MRTVLVGNSVASLWHGDRCVASAIIPRITEPIARKALFRGAVKAWKRHGVVFSPFFRQVGAR